MNIVRFNDFKGLLTVADNQHHQKSEDHSLHVFTMFKKNV